VSSGYDFFCKIILRDRPLPANIDAVELVNSRSGRGNFKVLNEKKKFFACKAWQSSHGRLPRESTQ